MWAVFSLSLNLFIPIKKNVYNTRFNCNSFATSVKWSPCVWPHDSSCSVNQFMCNILHKLTVIFLAATESNVYKWSVRVHLSANHWASSSLWIEHQLTSLHRAITPNCFLWNPSKFIFYSFIFFCAITLEAVENNSIVLLIKKMWLHSNDHAHLAI